VTELTNVLGPITQIQTRVFVRNATVQVIERGFMRGLPGIFAPSKVYRLGNEAIRAIAADTPETRERRRQLKQQVEALQDSVSELRGIGRTIDKFKVGVQFHIYPSLCDD